MLRESAGVPVALVDAETRGESDDVLVVAIDADTVCVAGFAVAVGFDDDDDEIEGDTSAVADCSADVVAHADVVALAVPEVLPTAVRESRLLKDGVGDTLGDIDGDPVTTDAVALRDCRVDGELEMLPVPLRVAAGEADDDGVPECVAVFTGDGDGDGVTVTIAVAVCVSREEGEDVVEPVAEPVRDITGVCECDGEFDPVTVCDTGEVADADALTETVIALVGERRGDSESVDDTVTHVVVVGLVVCTGEGESVADADAAEEALSPLDALGAADVELETMLVALVEGDPLVCVLADGVADAAVDTDVRGLRDAPVVELTVSVICGDCETDGVADFVERVEVDVDGDAVALRVPVEVTVVEAERVDTADCVGDAVVDGFRAVAVVQPDVVTVGDLDGMVDAVTAEDAE